MGAMQIRTIHTLSRAPVHVCMPKRSKSLTEKIDSRNRPQERATSQTEIETLSETVRRKADPGRKRKSEKAMPMLSLYLCLLTLSFSLCMCHLLK